MFWRYDGLNKALLSILKTSAVPFISAIPLQRVLPLPANSTLCSSGQNMLSKPENMFRPLVVWKVVTLSTISPVFWALVPPSRTLKSVPPSPCVTSHAAPFVLPPPGIFVCVTSAMKAPSHLSTFSCSVALGATFEAHYLCVIFASFPWACLPQGLVKPSNVNEKSTVSARCLRKNGRLNRVC